MGYTTEFDGVIEVTPPFTAAQVAYLTAFSESRRMKRDAAKTATMSDELRNVVGLPVGTEGEFYVGGQESYGVLDHNAPPSTQPGLWCQWRPTPDGTAIEWDGGEKFYDYTAWMKYIIDKFVIPSKRTANGVIAYQGEEMSDRGTITVKDNVVVEKQQPKRRVTRKKKALVSEENRFIL